MRGIFILACCCLFAYCISESLEQARKECDKKQGYKFIKPIGRNQPWQCVREE
jgi:hypothetical protein